MPGLHRSRAAAWAGALLVFGIAWASPISPGALQWADVALGLGRPDIAADQYERVAEWSPFVELQRQALYRGAMVSSVELGEPVKARRQLERLSRITATASDEAYVKERIASLLLDERQPLEAARVLRESHDLCLECPEAPRRLVRAAEVLADHGDPEEAIEAYAKVAELYPAHRARANIGRGQILLAKDATLDALELFEDAAGRTFDPDLQAVAKLGATTCLERLGSLDEALAELDTVDLPARVRASRREGMRARLP